MKLNSLGNETIVSLRLMICILCDCRGDIENSVDPDQMASEEAS